MIHESQQSIRRALLLFLAIVAMTIGGWTTANAQDLPALVENLQSPDDSIRRNAGNELFNRLESEYAEIVPLVAPLAGSGSEQTRYDAAKLLLAGSMVSVENATIASGLTSTYLALALDPSPRVSVVGIEGMALFPDGTPREAASSLIGLLSHADERNAIAAARTLGRLASTSPDVSSALLTVLNTTSNPRLRAAAAEALGRLAVGETLVVSGLIVALSDATPVVRQEAATALARIGGAARSAMSALQTIAENDPDPLVRQLASSAILAIERADAAPDCSGATASPSLFWPPNHKMIEVRVVGVTDPDGDPVTVTIEGVSQDEAVVEAGNGNSCPDAVLDGDDSAMIRAERSGRLDGRVYRILYSASDGKGGTCTGKVEVCVPHEEATTPTCVEEADDYVSTVCAK